MTPRERNILIIAGVVIVGGLAFNMAFGRLKGADSGTGTVTTDIQPQFQLEEANRLLRSQWVIKTHYRGAKKRLKEIEAGYLANNNIDDSQVKLLKEVEQLIVAANLDVQEKNIVHSGENEIGVSLAGVSGADRLVAFLQKVAAARINMRISRLQLSNQPEKRVLNYQIILTTLLVNKEKG